MSSIITVVDFNHHLILTINIPFKSFNLCVFITVLFVIIM